MNLVSQDTAILITAYTGGNDPSHYSCGDDNVIMSAIGALFNKDIEIVKSTFRDLAENI